MMTQAPPIEFLRPLLVGSLTIALTMLIHSLAVLAIVNFVRQRLRSGRVGLGFLSDTTIVMLATFFALLAHVTEILLWARMFIVCGEFQSFGLSFYHSAVNYTTLGYGDIIMGAWRLLGPLEAADGMLMFGLSTAMIFIVVQRLVEIRFPELGSWARSTSAD